MPVLERTEIEAISVLPDDGLCHADATAPHGGMVKTVCGLIIPDEPECCDPPNHPPCGRPPCSDCIAGMHS